MRERERKKNGTKKEKKKSAGSKELKINLLKARFDHGAIA